MQEEKIKCVGIIGGGKMGKSLFNHLYKYPCKIVWLNKDDTAEAQKKLKNKLYRLLKHGIVSEEKYKEECQRLTINDGFESLASCDLVIECITEDITAKNQLFSDIKNFLKTDAIVVSNSSSIIPDDFNIPASFKGSFAGMHFFFPVETNRLVEIIPTKETDETGIKQLRDFAVGIDKFVFLQNSESAFSVNRFFLDIQSSVFNYCEHNKIAFSDVDMVIRKHLFAAGVFATMDNIGINILYYAVGNYIKTHENPSQIRPLLDFLKHKTESEKVWEKEQHGFLKYPLEDFDVSEGFEAQILKDVNDIFYKFASAYIDKGIFTPEEMAMLIAEICGEHYYPLEF